MDYIKLVDSSTSAVFIPIQNTHLEYEAYENLNDRPKSRRQNPNNVQFEEYLENETPIKLRNSRPTTAREVSRTKNMPNMEKKITQNTDKYRSIKVLKEVYNNSSVNIHRKYDWYNLG